MSSTEQPSCDPIKSMVEDIIPHIFKLISLTDYVQCMCVCRDWYAFFERENCSTWRYICMRDLKNAMESGLLSVLPTYKSMLCARSNAWNPYDCSSHINIRLNDFTLFRMPVKDSTDGVRTKIGYKTGRHAWYFYWKGTFGTVAMVGVSTKRSPLRAGKYCELLGSNEHGWGWNLANNKLQHNGISFDTYQKNTEAGLTCLATPADTIRMVLDCEKHTLSFWKNNEPMGVAFEGLCDGVLFATVMLVGGESEVSIVYLGKPEVS